MQRLFLAAFAATVLVMPAAAADISGSWTVTGDVIGNAINMKCVFTQDGATISGTCTGAEGSTKAMGSVAADQVTFRHHVNRGQDFELTYTGTLDAAGTSMKGEIAVMGISGTFSAAKDAAAPKPDVAGNWTFTGEVVGNDVQMKCALKRDGDKLAGTCTYAGLGDSPTTGTVAADKVVLRNQVMREELYDLVYTGTLDAAGTSMKGEIAVEGVTGTFSGTKDK